MSHHVTLRDLLDCQLLQAGEELSFKGEKGVLAENGNICYQGNEYSSLSRWAKEVASKKGLSKHYNGWNVVHTRNRPLCQFRDQYYAFEKDQEYSFPQQPGTGSSRRKRSSPTPSQQPKKRLRTSTSSPILVEKSPNLTSYADSSLRPLSDARSVGCSRLSRACMLCRFGLPKSFSSSPLSWLNVVRFVLFLLMEREPKQRFFACQTEIYAFVSDHFELLGCNQLASVGKFGWQTVIAKTLADPQNSHIFDRGFGAELGQDQSLKSGTSSRTEEHTGGPNEPRIDSPAPKGSFGNSGASLNSSGGDGPPIQPTDFSDSTLLYQFWRLKGNHNPYEDHEISLEKVRLPPISAGILFNDDGTVHNSAAPLWLGESAGLEPAPSGAFMDLGTANALLAELVSEDRDILSEAPPEKRPSDASLILRSGDSDGASSHVYEELVVRLRKQVQRLNSLVDDERLKTRQFSELLRRKSDEIRQIKEQFHRLENSNAKLQNRIRELEDQNGAMAGIISQLRHNAVTNEDTQRYQKTRELQQHNSLPQSQVKRTRNESSYRSQTPHYQIDTHARLQTNIQIQSPLQRQPSESTTEEFPSIHTWFSPGDEPTKTSSERSSDVPPQRPGHVMNIANPTHSFGDNYKRTDRAGWK